MDARGTLSSLLFPPFPVSMAHSLAACGTFVGVYASSSGVSMKVFSSFEVPISISLVCYPWLVRAPLSFISYLNKLEAVALVP